MQFVFLFFNIELEVVVLCNYLQVVVLILRLVLFVLNCGVTLLFGVSLMVILG